MRIMGLQERALDRDKAPRGKVPCANGFVGSVAWGNEPWVSLSFRTLWARGLRFLVDDRWMGRRVFARTWCRRLMG